MMICSVQGCGKVHDAKGFCCVHYRRWRRYGDPLGSCPPLGRGRPGNGGIESGEALHFFREVALAWKSDDVCLIWPHGHSKNGYGKLRHNGRSRGVHRLLCEHVHGPAPSARHQAAHRCGHGQYGCVNPHHLVWKTAKENNADKIIHGTMQWGERSGHAKLKLEDIPRIRALEGTMTQREIAEMFGVSQSAIGGIFRGKKWAGVCPPPAPRSRKSGFSAGQQLRRKREREAAAASLT
jgi:hypothetical protein